MIRQLIARYKRARTDRYLRSVWHNQYAFIGMGQHSLANLYSVIHHLGVPLKYVCVTSEHKARLIEQKFAGIKATTSLDEVLNDASVSGIFVSASPTAHFSIASRVLKCGKSLFIEKPPCQSLDELHRLIDLQRQYCSPVAMVGLQRRYAPAVQVLKQRLGKQRPVNYDLHYLTGAYPEGDALIDLFIHPLDLACCLFGKPEIIACRQVGAASYLLMLQHPQAVGTLELSTAHSWATAAQTLKVCTTRAVYRLSPSEELTCEPIPMHICGVPIDKIRSRNSRLAHLCKPNLFLPVLTNNPIYRQGYFGEINTFLNAVEGCNKHTPTDFEAITDTYQLIEELRNLHAHIT